MCIFIHSSAAKFIMTISIFYHWIMNSNFSILSIHFQYKPFQFSLFFLMHFPVSLLPLQLLQGTNLASPWLSLVTHKPRILRWISRFIQLSHILGISHMVPSDKYLRQCHYFATNTICVLVTIWHNNINIQS